MLATVCRGSALRFDAVGRAAPAGNRVRNVEPVGSVTVTFRATAPAPGGTPPRPATTRSSVEAGPREPPARNWPSMVTPVDRVSARRAGASPVNAGPAGNQPSTSTTMSVLPVLLNSDTL